MLKLYEYRCPECKQVFEELVEDPNKPIECPKCKVIVEKVKIALSTHPKRQDWRV